MSICCQEKVSLQYMLQLRYKLVNFLLAFILINIYSLITLQKGDLEVVQALAKAGADLEVKGKFLLPTS